MDRKEEQASPVNSELVFEIDVKAIQPSPHQPRRVFDQARLKELADSIRDRGQLEPILVRSMSGEDGLFQLIIGERRLRAHKLIGKETIKALVKQVDSDEARCMTLVENLQREDLLPTEEARSLSELVNLRGGNRQAVADEMSKSLTYLADRLILIELPEDVQDLIDAGKINTAQAKVISELPDDAAKIGAAKLAVKLNLNANELKGRLQRQLPKKLQPSKGEGSVKFQQVSAGLIRLFDLLENFDFNLLLNDAKKRETLTKQINAVQKSLESALGDISVLSARKTAEN
jgi:ParB family chromosome partitioning protein